MFQQKNSKYIRSQMFHKIGALTNVAKFTNSSAAACAVFLRIFFSFFHFYTILLLLLKLVEYLFLVSFSVSLDKPILLHCSCLMSKFSEILILVSRKIFSAFSNETSKEIFSAFSSSCGLTLM